MSWFLYDSVMVSVRIPLVQINKSFECKIVNFFLSISFGAQKNRLIEMFLFSTHNISFG